MTKFKDLLTKQINNLKLLSLGCRNIPVDIANIKQTSICGDAKEASALDVTVNICDRHVTLQIFFDLNHPSCCPDVIVDCSEGFLPDIAAMESFRDWDVRSETALSDMVGEMYTAYLTYQRENVTEYVQLGDQVKELLNDTHICKGANCEVDIIKNGPGTFNDTVKIIVPLDVDYTKLPPYVKSKSPGAQSCRLCISYESPNLTKVTPTLELSANIQNALSKPRCTNLRIPAYGKSSLLEYATQVHQLVDRTIVEVGAAFERRKSLIFHLLSHIGECVLEYDAVTFYEATFLLEVDGFHFILFVILGPKFPVEAPSLFLQSIYSMDASTDIFRVRVRGFSYDPEWTDEVVFGEVEKVLHKNIKDFQEKSLAC